MDVRVTNVEQGLFDRVRQANMTDPVCLEYGEAIREGQNVLQGISLDDCRMVDGALYNKGLLWVPDLDEDTNIRTDIIQEIHDQPSSGPPGVARTIAMLKRHFYWPGCTADIKRYI